MQLKQLFRRKFIAFNPYIRKQERPKIYYPRFSIHKL